MPRWSAVDVGDVPTVPGEADDVSWHPLQHFLGLTAFGANVFVAQEGQTLVAEHDETASGQEELYLVLRGEVRFSLDGETVEAGEGTAVAVTDPEVRRAALAQSSPVAVLALGARPGCFETTWREEHFTDVPRAR